MDGNVEFKRSLQRIFSHLNLCTTYNLQVWGLFLSLLSTYFHNSLD
jgi:hypothetical protein